MTSYTAIQMISYLALVVAAVYFSFRSGEKSGSMYMLDYLRSNHYKDSLGNKVPFLNDTGFNSFMTHMRQEKKKKDE